MSNENLERGEPESSQTKRDNQITADELSLNETQKLSSEDKQGELAQARSKEQPLTADKRPKENKKSDPAKAFQDLRETVLCIDNKVEEIEEFVRLAKDKLFNEAESYRMEGQRPVLESLFQLHNLLFSRVTSMEAGETEPDGFVINLLDNLEGELERHNVKVIRPHSGETIDPKYMELLQSKEARFWRKPDTVATVHSCGFIIQKGNYGQVLRKARVDVYRKLK